MKVTNHYVNRDKTMINHLLAALELTRFYFLMLVLIFLYDETVWLVTMVTHSLATVLINIENPTYFRII